MHPNLLKRTASVALYTFLILDSLFPEYSSQFPSFFHLSHILIITKLIVFIEAIRRSSQLLLSHIILPPHFHPAERLISLLSIGYFLTAIISLIGGVAGVLGTAYFLGMALIIYFITEIYPPPSHQILPLFKLIFSFKAFPLWPGLILMAIACAIHLPCAPQSWDAMTYHLYIPVRWVQEARLFHVPTVFGDNAAAFAPKNGSLIHAAIIALSHVDLFSNIIWVPALCMGTLIIMRMAGEIIPTMNPSWPGGLTLLLYPLLEYTFTADMDLPAMVFLMASLYFIKILWSKPSFGIVFMASLNLGMATGFKVITLLYALPLLAALIWRLLLAKKIKLIITACFMIFAGGGYWYVWNWYSYGNPLFPVQIQLINWTLFNGAYGVELLHQSGFHTDDILKYTLNLIRHFSWAPLLLIPLGLTGCLILPSKRMIVILYPALAVLWIFFHFQVIPHNLEARFLLPSLVLAIPGFFLLLDYLIKDKLYLTGLMILILVTFLALSIHWLFLSVSNVFPVVYFIPVILSLGSFLFLITSLAIHQWKYTFMISLCILYPAVISALTLSPDHRWRSLSSADFRFWYKTYLPFNDPKAPSGNIAYTGLNIPHTLTGAQLNRKIIYCNIQGGLNKNYYDFWAHTRGYYSHSEQAAYRSSPNKISWLENLNTAQVDYLVVFLLHPMELKYIHDASNGFPIEEKWAMEHPEIFTTVRRTESGNIYKINRKSLNELLKMKLSNIQK